MGGKVFVSFWPFREIKLRIAVQHPVGGELLKSGSHRRLV
jgi:hypothetical protein